MISNVQNYDRVIEKSGIMEKMSNVPVPFMYKTTTDMEVLKAQYTEVMDESELTIDRFIQFLRHFADGKLVGIQGEEAGLGGFGRD